MNVAQRKAEPPGANGVTREAEHIPTSRVGSSALLAVIILLPLFMHHLWIKPLQLVYGCKSHRSLLRYQFKNSATIFAAVKSAVSLN